MVRHRSVAGKMPRMKLMKRPEGLMKGGTATDSLSPGDAAGGTISVVEGWHPSDAGAPRQVSRRKTRFGRVGSVPSARVDSEAKTTKRPSALIEGDSDPGRRDEPSLATETGARLGEHSACAPRQVSQRTTTFSGVPEVRRNAT